MELNIKKGWIISIGIVLILIITNPTKTDFKNYIGANYEGYYPHIRKTSNFLICCIYYDGSHNYLAILKNFIKIT